MYKISLFHPFSAEAVGLNQQDLHHSHSKPHKIALNSLPKEKYEVSVDYLHSDFYMYTVLVDVIKINHWPTFKSNKVASKRWRKENSLCHLLYHYIKPPDLTIINMSGHLSPYTKRFARLLHRKGKPYIAMVGGVHMATNDDALKYYKNADHIIVHTELQKLKIEKLNVFENLEIRVMPLGVDINIFKPLEFFEVKNRLLYVGRITRLKQIELSIDALYFCIQKGFVELTLTIVGPISDHEYYDELVRKTKNLALENQVNFIGSLPHEQLKVYYQEASILLLPSQHESFGMVMVEAMACGTPVIALKNSGGPEEIITHNITGLLCDNIDFSHSVYDVLINEEKHKQLSVNCRLSVIDKWSIETTTKVLKESINKVLNKN